MIAQNDKKQRQLMFGFLILVAAVLFVMNCPRLLIEPLALWYRILEPALLIIGLLGSVLDRKSVV